jgi:hypothetical protein
VSRGAVDGRHDALVEGDELAKVDDDHVRRSDGIEVVVRELDPGEDEERVALPGAFRLGEVGSEAAGVDASPRHPRGEPGVVPAVGVVDEAEDVP